MIPPKNPKTLKTREQINKNNPIPNNAIIKFISV